MLVYRTSHADCFILRQDTSPKDLEASSWFAFSASALGREAVEGKDGYTVLTFPSVGGANNNVQKSSGTRSEVGRSCVSWEYVGVSIV